MVWSKVLAASRPGWAMSLRCWWCFASSPFQEASKYLAILRRVTAENAFEIDGVLSVDLGLKLRFVEPAASYKQKMLEIGSTLVL